MKNFKLVTLATLVAGIAAAISLAYAQTTPQPAPGQRVTTPEPTTTNPLAAPNSAVVNTEPQPRADRN